MLKNTSEATITEEVVKMANPDVKPILSRSRYFTKNYDVKEERTDPRAKPKIQIKKYCDFLEIALQDLIKQSDEISK